MQPILIVEDDPRFRETVRSILEDEGWPVETASDGREALNVIARSKPALVVLDWGLRDVQGDSVVTGLRANHGPHIPVLLVTADGLAAHKASRIGAFGYLQKPFDLEELTELVRRGLDAG
jgi:DNA-binding response OmpR family regulator